MFRVIDVTAVWSLPEGVVKAYDFGNGTITTPDGKIQTAKYVVVWVHRDGKWKVAVDMFNANSLPRD